MTTRAITDRWTLAWLLAGHALRRLGRALSAPARRVSPATGRSTPERLVTTLQDLRTADPAIAGDIYGGYFAFAGIVATPTGRSPFEATPPSWAWAEDLMGFGWLRHLDAAGTAIARANARALVADWIATCGPRQSGPGWQPHVIARRLLSWLSHTALILDGADKAHQRLVLKSIGKQAACLSREIGTTQAGPDRLVCVIALVAAALCTGQSGPAARRSTTLLTDELDRQILPDGGHIGRNPQTLVDVLADLIPLRQAYASLGLEPQRALLNAIDRMMPALRLFHHGDGTLALFNGMSVAQADDLACVLAYSHSRAAALENAPHSGYQRIEAQALLLIMDTGAPPPRPESGDAHAGCLSFELSDGPHRIVVNCGAPPAGAEACRQMARATAAHSTLTLADTSSCRFVAPDGLGALLGTPVLAGPERVAVQRGAAVPLHPAGTAIRASHDGYLGAFGLMHERQITVDADGQALHGEDRIIVSHQARAAGAPDPFAIRFHLHPAVRVSRAAGGDTALIVLPGGRGWRFSAGGLPLAIEESVSFASPDGPRRCAQIVIAGSWRETPEIGWRFERLADQPGMPQAPQSSSLF